MQANCVHIDQFIVVGFSLVFPLFLFIPLSPTTTHHHPQQRHSNKISIDILTVQFTTELRDFDKMNGTRLSLKELKRLFRYPSAMVLFSSIFSPIYHTYTKPLFAVSFFDIILYAVRDWGCFHCLWWCFTYAVLLSVDFHS